MAQQPGIVEVELGALDQPLVEITMVGRQQENDETGCFILLIYD